MTMDVQSSFQNYKETKEAAVLNVESARTAHIRTEMSTNAMSQVKSSKRSFDVAFLMMPDDKVRNKPQEKTLRVSKQIFTNDEWGRETKRGLELFKCDNYESENLEKERDEDVRRMNNNVSPSFGSEINIDVGTDEYPNRTVYCSDSENSERSTRSRPNSNESASRLQTRYLPEYKNKIFDDPSLISIQSRVKYESSYMEKHHDASPKSAFTKVTNYSMRSPDSSVSPDNLLYQNSVSPPISATTPPSNAFSKSNALNTLLNPAQLLNGNNFFKNQNPTSSSVNYANGVFNKGIEYHGKHNEPIKTSQISPSKLNFLPFRPEMPYLQASSAYPFGVQNFQPPNAEYMKFPAQPRESVNPLISNPAAAILSTLLPPTLAAFSLPAQNVCAKCSISFRMTSDLVYHMRTHHKNESAVDPNRRKREEKLKCPVCNESFRERHHLTRHMTAHQDKEGDLDEIPSTQNYSKKTKQCFQNNVGSFVHK